MPIFLPSNPCIAISDLNGNIHTRRQVELLKLIDRFGGRTDNVQQALMGPDFKLFHGLLVRVRAAINAESFDSRWQRDRSRDAGAGPLGGLHDVARRLIQSPKVIRLQAYAYALLFHT